MNRAFIALLAFCLHLPILAADKKAGPKAVLVHYMPWYASKPISGHWTMDRFNPDKVGAGGNWPRITGP